MLCVLLLKGVKRMKFDSRLVTGIFIGMVLGLHYHASLVTYLPIMIVATLILVLKAVHH